MKTNATFKKILSKTTLAACIPLALIGSERSSEVNPVKDTSTSILLQTLQAQGGVSAQALENFLRNSHEKLPSMHSPRNLSESSLSKIVPACQIAPPLLNELQITQGPIVGAQENPRPRRNLCNLITGFLGCASKRHRE